MPTVARNDASNCRQCHQAPAPFFYTLSSKSVVPRIRARNSKSESPPRCIRRITPSPAPVSPRSASHRRDPTAGDALGTTPSRYILARRLHSAREVLRNARSASVTVAALDQGFEHLGRFSQHYQTLFGELPSRTLQRSRRLRIGDPTASARPASKATASW
ncbi:helix-turn-helix domain-containing protein [Thiorhodococcus minor]|uniref:helix-turn-helix domain-containing protein n=1 Tax=Thiorhodococcus minor TaxID=57489 RepID=UPI003CC913B3